MPDITADAVLEQLQPIFQEVLSQPDLVITRESTALNTKNWDSLAHIDLMEMIESHFKVRFALGELQEMKKVGDLVDMIVVKVGKK